MSEGSEPKTLGDLVYERRKKLGLSQTDLGIVSLRDSWCNVEGGNVADLTVWKLVVLSDKLGIPIEEMVRAWQTSMKYYKENLRWTVNVFPASLYREEIKRSCQQ